MVGAIKIAIARIKSLYFINILLSTGTKKFY